MSVKVGPIIQTFWVYFFLRRLGCPVVSVDLETAAILNFNAKFSDNLSAICHFWIALVFGDGHALTQKGKTVSI